MSLLDDALAKLTEAMSLLADAAKWADRDRFSFSPVAIFSGPLKYWKWHKAKRVILDAGTLIAQLRARCKEARDLEQVEIDIPKLDMISDMFDVLPFSVRRPRSVSPIRQMFTPETTVLHEIETARTTVDHAMSEVGLLHAKLRAKYAS